LLYNRGTVTPRGRGGRARTKESSTGLKKNIAKWKGTSRGGQGFPLLERSPIVEGERGATGGPANRGGGGEGVKK